MKRIIHTKKQLPVRRPSAKPAATPSAKPVATPSAKPVATPSAKPVAKPAVRRIGRGYTSVVTLDPNTQIVTKQITNFSFDSWNIYEREVYWLKYLNEKGYTWCPKLTSSDSKTKTIQMEYVGVPINRNNAPKDWRAQLSSILSDLAKENIKHNDIKNAEVLVKAGKLYLIDYGWSSKGNDWSCGQGFSSKQKPCHEFHDHSAISRIARSLR